MVFEPSFPHRLETFRLRLLVEKIKPVVMDIHEFEWRYLSVLGVLLAFLDIKIETQERSQWRSSLPKTKDWCIAARSEVSGYGELIFWKCWTTKNLTQKSILMVFQSNRLSQNYSCHLRPCWKKLSEKWKRILSLNKSKKLSIFGSGRMLIEKTSGLTFEFESSSLSLRMLIVITIWKIQPVVSENHLFDNRDESLSVTFFGQIQRSISMVFQRNPPLQE